MENVQDSDAPLGPNYGALRLTEGDFTAAKETSSSSELHSKWLQLEQSRETKIASHVEGCLASKSLTIMSTSAASETKLAYYYSAKNTILLFCDDLDRAIRISLDKTDDKTTKI